jgi:hypothetical protein
VPAAPPGSGKGSRGSSRYPSVSRVPRVRTRPGPDGLARPEGVPLMIVKKVLTPYGRLSAAKLLATLCRVWPIEARPDGTGDVVANDAPVGSKSTDDV